MHFEAGYVAPRWSWTASLGVDVGTAFAGSSPVTPTTPLRRIKTAFSTAGTGKIGCR